MATQYEATLTRIEDMAKMLTYVSNSMHVCSERLYYFQTRLSRMVLEPNPVNYVLNNANDNLGIKVYCLKYMYKTCLTLIVANLKDFDELFNILIPELLEYIIKSINQLKDKQLTIEPDVLPSMLEKLDLAEKIAKKFMEFDDEIDVLYKSFDEFRKFFRFNKFLMETDTFYNKHIKFYQELRDDNLFSVKWFFMSASKIDAPN